jgi:DNA-binding GntR family transcriptional regulator
MATSGTQLKPLKPDSLVTLAYESIRGSIIDGRYAMGEHVIESRIAGELSISRAPVREALNRLIQEGLLVDKPRRGVFVREMTAKDFIDIYNMRLAIETAAVRLAIAKGESFNSLETTIASMGRAASKGQVAKTVALELRAHEQICEASQNTFLINTFQSLLGPVHMALGLDDSAYQNLEDVAAEHVTLLAELRTGDSHTASVALHRHIVSTVGPVLDRLGGNPGELLTVDS